MRIPDRIGLVLSVVLFGVPAVLLWLATRLLLPALIERGWEPLLAWFAAGGLTFAPLFAAAVIGARMTIATPSWPALLEALRVRRLNAGDWRLAGLALAATGLAMGVMQAINATLGPGLPPHPPFMSVQPLAPAQYYIFLLWAPFFALNIIGEEVWWRGFIQPRQEPVFGRATWVAQGLLHGVFHVSFGLGVLFIIWPVLFSIPWAVQRSRNTSVGMVIHAGVNGSGFLAVTLGVLPQ